MVRIQDEDEQTRLDRAVRETATAKGLLVDVNGWARRTYDVYDDPGRGKTRTLLARLESFATRSGEVLVFDDAGLDFAQAVGARLEKEFGLAEAVIKRGSR